MNITKNATACIKLTYKKILHNIMTLNCPPNCWLIISLKASTFVETVVNLEQEAELSSGFKCDTELSEQCGIK